MPKVRDVYDPDDDDESMDKIEASYLICPVWPIGCHHPGLCKEECCDNDLQRERSWTDPE